MGCNHLGDWAATVPFGIVSSSSFVLMYKSSLTDAVVVEELCRVQERRYFTWTGISITAVPKLLLAYKRSRSG